ncbi:MAG: hypothetical protein EKK64_11010 [Neisseriaceae bacterium]|nr:MAG: hypothetical protein EKK64_11010 [Neisseriaceae bacterium]
MSEIQTKSSLGARLIILLLIGVISVGVYYAVFDKTYGVVEQRKQNAHLQEQVSQLTNQLQKIDQQNKENNQQIIGLLEQQNQLQVVVNNLKPNDKTSGAELSVVLNLANQSLVVNNDIQAAVNLLTSANQMLSTESDSKFESLQASINKDITNLQQASSTENVADIMHDVNQISILHSKLIAATSPIEMDKNKQAIQTGIVIEKDQAESGSKLSIVWNSIKQALSSVVKVSKTDNVNPETKVDDNATIVVTNNNSQVNHLNIALEVSMLKVALITRNQTLWTTSLNNIRDELKDGYQHNSDYDELMLTIKKLDTIDMNVLATRNIDATLQMLRQVN